MKNETIIKEAEKRGLKWEYKKYMYWECLFVEGTAITFREHGSLQGQCVVQPQHFPKFATVDFIFRAVAAKAEDLGFCNLDWRPFDGLPKWKTWENDIHNRLF